jgi:hypothetical protein
MCWLSVAAAVVLVVIPLVVVQVVICLSLTHICQQERPL